MYRTTKALILGIGVLCLLWGIGLVLFAHYAQEIGTRGFSEISTTVRSSETQPYPYRGIVVLTGGQGRVAIGAELLQAEIAPALFITGVGGGSTQEQLLPNLPERWRDLVHLGREADDTFGNVAEAQQWLQYQEANQTLPESSEKRVILVSSHYHLPRAIHLFSQAMPEITWVPYAVTPESFVIENWYQQLVGWRILSKELLKFLWVYTYV